MARSPEKPPVSPPENPPDGGSDRSIPNIDSDQPSPEDGLSARQHAAISALLTEKTQAEAAVRAQVAEPTLRRWLADPLFKTAYRAARRQVMEGVIGRLQQAAVQAVDALERNLTCGKPGCEIQAAVAVLDHAAKGLELADLAERLEAVEQALAAGD
jgi:hypothetical protein